MQTAYCPTEHRYKRGSDIFFIKYFCLKIYSTLVKYSSINYLDPAAIYKSGLNVKNI